MFIRTILPAPKLKTIDRTMQWNIPLPDLQHDWIAPYNHPTNNTIWNQNVCTGILHVVARSSFGYDA